MVEGQITAAVIAGGRKASLKPRPELGFGIVGARD